MARYLFEGSKSWLSNEATTMDTFAINGLVRQPQPPGLPSLCCQGLKHTPCPLLGCGGKIKELHTAMALQLGCFLGLIIGLLLVSLGARISYTLNFDGSHVRWQRRDHSLGKGLRGKTQRALHQFLRLDHLSLFKLMKV